MAPITILKKRVTSTDIRHRLPFPTAKLHLLPPFEEGANWVEFPVRVRNGVQLNPHVLRCVVRRKGYRKPVLERGWRQIVREKELREGDLLIFYVDDHDGEFMLEFKRSIKLMGHDLEATI